MSETAKYVPDMIAWRRHLHMYPEASFEEHETVAYLRDVLTKRAPSAKLSNPTPTSLLATFDTGKPGPTIGIRSDIDGLVMQEDRPDLEFASRNENRMHGCGHDGHMAVVLSAMAWVEDNLADLNGQVVGIFQHAEETPPGGAKEMVATGLFNDFDFIFGFHLWSTMPTGLIDIKEGPASANSDLWQMTFTGKGAHASTPEDSISPVIAAANMTSQLMSIAAVRVNGLQPAVVTTTYMEAGSANALNVIPPTAKIGGVVRTHSDDVQAKVRDVMGDLIAGAERANPGMEIELDYLVGYPMVWNDPARTAIVHELAEERFPGKIVTEPAMLGGEDFAEFSRVAPSTYVFVGAGNPDKGFDAGHHNPRFGIDEDSLEIALQLTIDVLKNRERLASG
ncbi:M20 metallopeptidase family protein [Trueperella bialowiezensis]|uniref:N-acyl-L-amino acid amidohydrolase n=1 Tax=Trueperella bialowiezensis TaxID=312285 RepID=A0A448PCZ4_9ACTO|nr:amidohydrolase [Trueperella bialowiezensis]VEI12813.1 N-acyl-L-amino acid amidohydrolase [Trueperella bialowiezensis]